MVIQDEAYIEVDYPGDFRWEDPPPAPPRGSRGYVPPEERPKAHFRRLARHPGRWARLRIYANRAAAYVVAAQLRGEAAELRVELVVRDTALYGRCLGDG